MEFMWWPDLMATDSHRTSNPVLDYLQSQLNTGLWRVMDEYGETIPIAELEKRIRKSLDCITLRDYYQKHPEERQWGSYGPQQELSSDGSRWWDEDFW